MLNTPNITDSSDDNNNTGTAAIMIESESEDKVEIDPYWSKIKTDELQEIRKPMEVLFSDTDSIPNLESVVTLSNKETGEPGKLTTFLIELLLDKTDSMLNLESVPEFEVSGKSVSFVFTPANTENSEMGSFEEAMDMFNDEEMVEFVINQWEDALTTLDAAMLVNVKGSVEGMQTELYDSGVLHHMLPYQDHFENYMPITPKLITAADKCYFSSYRQRWLTNQDPEWLQHNHHTFKGCSSLP